jgi:hypothetical protein
MLDECMGAYEMARMAEVEDTARSALGDDAYEAACAEGGALTMDEAVAYALGEVTVGRLGERGGGAAGGRRVAGSHVATSGQGCKDKHVVASYLDTCGPASWASVHGNRHPIADQGGFDGLEAAGDWAL